MASMYRDAMGMEARRIERAGVGERSRCLKVHVAKD